MSSIEAACFGSLARDAELKTSKSGKQYLRFTLRVGDDDAAQWVSVLAFDPRAVELADKFVKGARVYCEGKLSLNEWHDKDGVVKTGLNVMSFHCRLAQIGRQKANKETSEPRWKPARPIDKGSGGRPWDDSIPFAPEVR